MYTKDFIPLTPDEIKKVNASELASKYNVSQSYVSRVLKRDKAPTSLTAKEIMADAKKIVAPYLVKTELEK